MLFVVNGLTFASVIVWFPVIKSDLGLSNVALGIGIAAGPLGGLGFAMLAGPLVARFGSGRVATFGAVAGAFGVVAVGLVGVWWLFLLAMFWLGSADAIGDAAMNSHGLRVQRRYGRSIINSFHALWSLGAVLGGVIGALAVSGNVPRPVHLSLMAAVLVVATAVSFRWQLSGPEESDRPAGSVHLAEAGAVQGVRQAVLTAPGLLISFGLVAAMAGALEDSAASWAAIHLRETLGAAPFVAGLGFVAAQTTMVIGRTVGDRLVDRFSARAVVRTGSILGFLGMFAVVWGQSPGPVIAGFALTGLGVATLFPLGIGAAGDVPGVRSADGVAVASWLARLSFFVIPPIVGAIADGANLRWGLSLLLGCAGAAFLLARSLPAGRDRSGLSDPSAR